MGRDGLRAELRDDGAGVDGRGWQRGSRDALERQLERRDHPRLGFLYNNHMHNFNPRAGFRNSVAPGKLPEASEGPLLASRDGRPFLVIGHYSRAGATAEAQVYLNVVDFGMSLQEAVAQPRIHAEYALRTIIVDPDFPPALIEGVEALGVQKVTVRPISPAVSAIARDRSSGQVFRALDPRAERGTAVAP